MPELPEVETVCRGLAPVMVGATLERVEQRRANLRFPFPDNFVERLEGRKIAALTRRAKYALVTLGSVTGSGSGTASGDTLVMHLGMSGRFRIETAADVKAAELGEFEHDASILPQHDHVVFHMSNGTRVTYNDARRFGYMTLVRDDEFSTHPLFATLGVEPLGNSFGAGYLAENAQGKTTDMKAFLMDQRIVAGLGNIYVCEALYRAQISPKRKARFLANARGKPTERAERLATAVRDVLSDAVEAGGSTLRDHRQADGSLGYFQHSFSVYGREDEPCRRTGCSGTVKRYVKSGRSTFHCSTCQR